MAVDVVTLQIRVDASQVEEATRRLSGLGTTATVVDTKTKAAAVGTTHLNNALRTLAVQATGADPVVGRLVSSIGGFAIQGVLMSAALLGVAAIGLAWRRMGEDARFASQQADELIARLQKINGSTQGRWDQIMASGMLAGARGDLAAIRGEGVMGGTRGLGLAATRAARENAALNRVLLLSRYSESAVEQGYEFTGPTLAQRGSLGGGGGGVGGGTSGRGVARSMAGLTPFGAFGFSGATAGVDIGGIADRIAQEIQRRAAAEQDLADARVRANTALVQSLANVGRAYGGVTDQVLNLAAATMSIYQAGRMPTDTRTDRATALGSAALAGVGFGQSTGNPILGALGGGAAGYGMVGTAMGGAGIIVGAVGGIVSGLIEQGQRARQAQLQWDMALKSFENMWDTLTPQQQTQQAFEQMTGGRSVEEVRRMLAEWRSLPKYLQPEDGISRLMQWLASYDRQMEQAAEVTKDAAAAERELYDARFRASNAPSGFNTSYYGWMAGFGGDSPQKQANADAAVEVHVYVDGEEVATRVESHARRAARRGGPSPYLDTAR